MEDKIAKLQEVANRNLQGQLPPEKRAIFDEAVRRGLVKTAGEMSIKPAHQSGEMMPSHAQQSKDPLFGQFFDRMGVDSSNPAEPAGAQLDIVQAATNAPGEAVDMAKGMWQAVRHPVETAEGVNSLVLGAMRKAGFEVGAEVNDQIIDQVWQGAVKNYGSQDAAVKAFNERPLQTLSDIALGAMGIKAALRTAQAGANIVGAPVAAQKLGSAAETARKIADTVEPLNAMTKATFGALAKSLPPTMPREMYVSATKMSTGKKLTNTERNRLAQFAVDQGIMPTEAGIAKAFDRVSDLDAKVQGIIDGLDNAGNVAKVDDILGSLNGVRGEILSTYIAPDKYLKAIDSLEDQVRNAQGRYLTPRQMQNFKSGIYKEIQEMYRPNTGALNSTQAAQKSGKKALARALKLELEKMHPEIKNINAEEGSFLALVDAIEPAVKRIANRDKVGIGVPLKATAGEIMGQSAGMPMVGGFLGAMQGVMDAPLVKSRLAIVLNKAQRDGVRVPGSGARTLSYQALELPETERN